jgi:hypothetical protein
MQLLDRGHAPLVGIAPTLAAPNPPYNTDRPDTPHPATILVSARPEPQKPHQTTNGRQSNVTIRDCYQTPVDPGLATMLASLLIAHTHDKTSSGAPLWHLD